MLDKSTEPTAEHASEEITPTMAPTFARKEPWVAAVHPERGLVMEADGDEPIGILMIGDIVGKPGRDTLAAVLPELRRSLPIDLVVANVENLAHGFGITPETIAQISSAGVDVFTGGNHTWKNAAGVAWLQNQEPPTVLRPANIFAKRPGADHVVVSIPHVEKPLVISCALGEVFMKDPVYSPYTTFDTLYALYGESAFHILDFHAEATGEKRIMSWHLDGRASILVGTHTHTPTADEQIMPDGLAFISDLGFTGAKDSSLGMRKDLVARKVILREDASLEPPDSADEGVFHALFVRLDRTTGKAISVERIQKEAAL